MNLNRIFFAILLSIYCSVTCWSNNYVVINQVMYDTPLNEKTNTSPYSNGEFIELYNAGSESVSLQGWTISGDGVSEVYNFPDDLTIMAGHYLILACRRGSNNTFQLSDLYSLPESDDLYTIIYQNKIVLANTGETITLCNAVNDTIDVISYDGSSSKTKPNRLSADNEDSTIGDMCVSLHRTWVEFDRAGRNVSGADRWVTSVVSFASHLLPYSMYHEDSLFGGHTLPVGENYILSITPLDPTSRIDCNNGQVSISSGVRTHATLAYMDGLGRQEQSIDLGASPDKEDIVSLVEYADKNNPSKQWLPIPIQTEGQRISKGDFISAAQFVYADMRPFMEFEYEKSIERRVSRRYLPGESYQSHYASKSYSVIDNSCSVRIYTVIRDSVLKTTGASYNPHTLYVTSTADEDGKYLTTYVDKLGQKVLEDRGGNLTYYVYDDIGRLRYVLPHLVQSKLTNGEYQPSHTTIESAAYYYQYDNRGNIISKRLPGCAPQYFVYDCMGQMILSQDGNQRKHNLWTICAYDSVGRSLYTAELPLIQSHEDLVSMFADKWQVEHYGNNLSKAISGTGYASSVLGTSGLRLLTVNYYDDYDFLSRLSTPVRQMLRFEQEPGYGIPHDSAKGLLTGTRYYNLSEPGYTATAYYYDALGQVVQSRSTRSIGGYAITSSEYLFDGSIAKKMTQQGENDDWISERYRYTYDHVGRVLKTIYQLNEDPEIELSSYLYDSIGHLAQNLLHNAQDTVAYSYDMRNMLTDTRHKYFSESLFYADNLPQSAIACYNGNIAASTIMHTDSLYSFCYQYDHLNRLTSSQQQKEYGNFFSEKFDYDDAGNITNLKRFLGTRLIDNLSYSYGADGCQVLSITDDGQDVDLYGQIEYPSIVQPLETTMRYDANGNLISDADRGISVIHYNILNLPDTIQFLNGHQIVNLYNASGQKYRSIYHTNIVPVTAPSRELVYHPLSTPDSADWRMTDFWGSIEVSYTPRDTTYSIFNSIGYYRDSTYYFMIKDHIGNVCAVVDAATDSLVQSTLYYASGVPMLQSCGRDTQPYLYNGKEFIESNGYNVYDYGFRGYYATVGRFTSVDPLAEQTPWQSPYVYANSNPIRNVDWMGLMGIHSPHRESYGLTILDEDYNVIWHTEGDLSVYIWQGDGEFNSNNYNYGDLIWIGLELPMVQYEVGKPCFYMRYYTLLGSPHFSPYSYPMSQTNYYVAYGNDVATPSQLRKNYPVFSLVIDVPLTFYSSDYKLLKSISSIRLGLGFVGADWKDGVISAVPGVDIVVDLKNIYNKYMAEDFERVLHEFQKVVYDNIFEPFNTVIEYNTSIMFYPVFNY